MAQDMKVAFPIQLGSCEVRLAETPEDVAAVQELRYRAFYGAGGAKPTPEVALTGRDADRYDAVCDHLMMVNADGAVLGTYRLQRQEVARRNFGFYAAGEFHLSRLEQQIPEGLLEVGRAAHHPDHRDETLMPLLIGMCVYVLAHDVKYLFGCGSLPGTDLEAHAATLQFLHDHYPMPEELRVRALVERYIPMDRGIVIGAPPLLPALMGFYSRLGTMHIGDGAVLDTDMNTTDVFVGVPVATVAGRYLKRFSRILR